MRPTTKDLAKAAGVSLATVDRVLNDRPNVSAKSVVKVNDAIDKIGFVRNMAAVNLARSKTYKFRFILPTAGDQYLTEISEEVRKADEALRNDLTMVDIQQTDMNDPHIASNTLSLIEAGEVDGVAVMAPESPQVRDAMARLSERGIHVVQFLSGQEKLEALDFVGVDNFAAGATAGRLIGRFTGARRGKVLIIADTMQSLDSIERRLGFDDILNKRFPHLTPLPSLETHGDNARIERIVQRTLKHNRDIVAAYIMSFEARNPVSCLKKHLDIQHIAVVAHERTPFTETALRGEEIDAIIAQNPGHAVRSAIRIMRARTDQREPQISQEQIRIEILVKENL